MKKLIWTLQLAVFIFSSSTCFSQDTFSKVSKSENRNYYKFDAQIDSIKNGDPTNLNYEWASNLYSLKSNYKNYLSIWDSIPLNNNIKISIDSTFIGNSYNTKSAKDYIIEQSKNARLVIINEDHENNFNRVFGESLLDGLYKNGYRLLFLETLSNGKNADTLLNERKYPTNKTGYYSDNPQFGNFIRKALKLGFKLFPYESTAKPGSIDEDAREHDQAENVVKILEKYPQEKAFMYVGYAHNREGKMESWGKAVAELIKDKTGIDPLTIDQETFSEKGSKTLSNILLTELNLKNPSVLLNKNKEPYRTKTDSSWVDITVFHPFTTYKNGKPNWLFYDGKKSVSIDLESIKIEFPIMLMAYNNEDEIINLAVPIDIVEIANQKEIATLVLNKGNYVIKAINKDKMYQLLEKTVE